MPPRTGQTAARRSRASARDARRREARRREAPHCARTSHRSRAALSPAARAVHDRRATARRPAGGSRSSHQAGARREEAALVGKVRIERMPLHAGTLGHHAERRLPPARRCRADPPPPRRCAAASPPAARRGASGCRSGASYFIAHICASILTRRPNFTTHICILKYKLVHPGSGWQLSGGTNHGNQDQRDRRRHLPALHLRARHRPAGRLHLQPVPRPRRRAAAVPHRPEKMFPLVRERSAASSRPSDCAGSPSATTRPTSAGR